MSKTYVIEPGAGIESLTQRHEECPLPARRQVRVRLHAASLNYRDFLVADGRYGQGGSRVPLSDGAGEVVDVGPDCTRFAVGDRVAGLFMQGWTRGEVVDADMQTALGGPVDGVLCEERLFEESGLVAIPDSLSFEAAATLPCAALTAWNALHGLKTVASGDTVLALGTGGVSTFAVQFAAAAGARVIITSSSDDKLARVRALGADEGINYRTTPNWGEEARRLTGGRGVDFVVETGGPQTLPQSLAAVRRGGLVNMIGVLGQGEIDPLTILASGAVVRGTVVGSGEMFEAMNRAIERNAIGPIIDRVFGWDQAQEAYRYLRASHHVGKVVIRFDR
ncbi:zinc-dependent alcohol dehydrogenase family protein [Salinicola avicenniae]|uniref:zinc-dependent alcohol dehydrogenase family protein n=1 Tax=Salinicola avicenniae TaxID=2916836 RepID=UPI0020748CA0|nr:MULTISPECIES: NAD(P)-dependent alcohol dehydrogenase [unclassified Salinicola]